MELHESFQQLEDAHLGAASAARSALFCRAGTAGEGLHARRMGASSSGGVSYGMPLPGACLRVDLSCSREGVSDCGCAWACTLLVRRPTSACGTCTEPSSLARHAFVQLSLRQADTVGHHCCLLSEAHERP